MFRRTTLLLLASAGLLVGLLHACAPALGLEGVLVLVEFEPGLRSRCVKVSATEAGLTRETDPMPLSGQASPLRVAVAKAPNAELRVFAQGYADEACTDVVTDELSDPVTTTDRQVTLRLTRVASGDGGFVPDGGADGGTSDAGGDAGVVVDDDLDGVSPPDDCDDHDALVFPGAVEACTNGRDDDCDQRSDCADEACAQQGCMGGGVCRDGGCVAATEVDCADGFDNDLDGKTDCLDVADCPLSTACNDFDVCTAGERCVVDGGCEKTSDTCSAPPGACFDPVGACFPDAGTLCVYSARAGSCDDGLACTDTDTCMGGSCQGTARDCPASTNTCLLAGVCSEASDGGCVYAPRAVGSAGCDDGQRCTVGDTCDGDGGCVGTPVTCTPPGQCYVSTARVCDDDGGCEWAARTGACDAGTRPGVCQGDFSCAPTFVSCLDLFQFAPSTPTGNYAIDPDGLGGGNPFTVRCEMEPTDGGWTQLAFDDFTNGAPGWSDARRDTTSTCFGQWGVMLGGYNVFGTGASTTKTFDLRGVPHSAANVRARLYIIDSWDNEAARMSLAGTLVYDTNFGGGNSNICGAGWWDVGRRNVSGAVPHTTNSLDVNFTSTLSQTADDESFGVDDVRVLVR